MSVDIRTDVDHLISTLEGAPGKLFTLEQLVDLTGMSEAAITKWLKILEEQRRVRIDYTLTQTTATWATDSPVYPIVEKRARRETQHAEEIKLTRQQSDTKYREEGPSYYPISEEGTKNVAEKEKKFDYDADILVAHSHEESFRKQRVLKELHEEKRRLQEMLRVKKGGKEKIEAPDAVQAAEAEEVSPAEKEIPAALLRKPILPRLVEVKAEEKEGAEKQSRREKPSNMLTIEEKPAVPLVEMADIIDEWKSEGRIKADVFPSEEELSQFEPKVAEGLKVEFGPEIKMPKMPKPDPELEKFSGKLATHMAKISAKAAQIDRLKAEKKKILREIYTPLESKVQGELEEISDRILDYESRMLKLREHVASLPNEISDVSERHEKMAAVAREMQTAYDETNALLEQSLSTIEEARAIAQEKSDEIRRRTVEQEFGIGKAEGALSELAKMQSEAESRLEAARGALEQQRQALQSSQTGFAALSHAKAEIEGELEAMKSEISRQHSVLSDLDSHIGRMEKVREWVQSNRKEYDRRMSELAEYVRNGDAEYSKMRESVEANFVRRYLKELRAVSEGYEFELSQAQMHEAEIDSQISKVKGELGTLIEEGKHLAQLHEMQLAETGIGKEMQLAVPAHERLFGKLRAAGREQEKIRKYIRGTISGEKGSGREKKGRAGKAGKGRRK